MSAQQAAEAQKSGASYVANQLGVGSMPEHTNQSSGTAPKPHPTELSSQGSLGSGQGGVPGQVLSSQREAQWGPEAAGNPDAVLEKRDFENELKSKILETRPVGEGREQAYFLDQPDTLESHRGTGSTNQGGSFAADTTAALSAASQVGSSATQTTGDTFARESYPSVGTERQTSPREQASSGTVGSYQDGSTALRNAQTGSSLSTLDSDPVLGTAPSQGEISNQRNNADLGKVSPGTGQSEQESDTVLGTAPTSDNRNTGNESQQDHTGQHSENKMSDPNDPYWQGKETAREHLDHQAKEGKGTRENVDAIPTAGGQRLGEKHWGESKKID